MIFWRKKPEACKHEFKLIIKACAQRADAAVLQAIITGRYELAHALFVGCTTFFYECTKCNEWRERKLLGVEVPLPIEIVAPPADYSPPERS